MNVLFCLQVKVAACVCSSCPALTQRSFCCWTWTQPCSQWLEAEVWKALALLIHVLEGILLSSFLCLSRVQCLFLCIHWANLFIWTNVFHVNRHADSCGAHLELTKSSWFVCWTLPWVLRAACSPNCWGCSLYILISLTNCSFSFLILQNTVKASEETRQFLDKLMSRGPWFYGSSPDPVPDWLGAAGRGLGFVAGCHLRVTPRLRCQNGKAPRNNDQKSKTDAAVHGGHVILKLTNRSVFSWWLHWCVMPSTRQNLLSLNSVFCIFRRLLKKFREGHKKWWLSAKSVQVS